ncbi:MAG: DUF4382 domain-containing protein, partial [Anaerolineae bacterium]|nr:DUF4382 domain-containing protein [Anaerolineae bacterium]
FGDGAYPANGILNRMAMGFEPLAALAEGGMVDVDLAELEQHLSPDDYALLMGAVPELGKVGDGRCYYGAP